MELADFVKDSLVAIAMGVKDANVAPDNPGVTYKLPQGISTTGERLIEFDVAVTLSKAESAGASAGLKVHVVSASIGGDEKSSEQRVSHIRFRVAVVKDLS